MRSHAFAVDGRGYDLMLGLRRHRDWPVLRPRSVQAAVDSLLRAYRLVVADVDADLEGDDEVGSVDVEERNVLARTTAAGPTSCWWSRRRRCRAPPARVAARRPPPLRRRPATDCSRSSRRAPRRARGRAEIADAIGALAAGVDHDLAAGLAAPVFLPERRGLDELHRSGRPLPHPLVGPITEVVEALLDRAPLVPAGLDALEPVPVAVGSLGSWADERRPDRSSSSPPALSGP